MGELVTFGVIAPPGGADVVGSVRALADFITRETGITIDAKEASSYEALAKGVREGAIDAAWLPPIVYVRCEEYVQALGSILRGSGGKAGFEAALAVRDDGALTTVPELKGRRAGWVDRWSAAGFVLPRLKLALSGIDPRKMFRTETFQGSHKNAVRSLLDGACDVIGTYARCDDAGNILDGAWSDVPGAKVKVLTTFGAVPPDIVALRKAVDPDARRALSGALAKACRDEKALVRAVFNGTEFEEGLALGYDALKTALELATNRGLFD